MHYRRRYRRYDVSFSRVAKRNSKFHGFIGTRDFTNSEVALRTLRWKHECLEANSGKRPGRRRANFTNVANASKSRTLEPVARGSPLIRKSHRWLLERKRRTLTSLHCHEWQCKVARSDMSWQTRANSNAIICFFQIDDPIHVISIDETSSTSSRQKPPDYETVTDAPPSYDDAIKLNPSQLFSLSNGSTASSLSSGQIIPTSISIVSPTLAPPPPYAR